MQHSEERRELMKFLGLAAATSLVSASASATEPAERASAISIRKLAWAGVLIETASNALFIDAIAPDPKQGQTAAMFKTDKVAHALITHNHGDHFDNATVNTLLGKNGLLMCQRACADWVDQRGLRVQPVDFWQPVFIPRYGDDIVAFAVPAVDGWGVPQSSWVIDVAGLRMFHGGDTQWHGRFADYGRAYGPFDAAFLPINGARQQSGRFSDLGIPAVLTPPQAVAAAKLLRAKLIVPIHYGGSEPPEYVEVADPLGELARVAEAAKIPVRVLAVGASFDLAHERSK